MEKTTTTDKPGHRGNDSQVGLPTNRPAEGQEQRQFKKEGWKDEMGRGKEDWSLRGRREGAVSVRERQKIET